MKQGMLVFLTMLSTVLGASQQSMLDTVGAVRAVFEAGYAPAEWKKSYSNWDLNDEIEKVRQEILAKPEMSTKEFQQSLNGFFLSTHDYHTGAVFTSTEFSELGFQIKKAEGRYFIVFIDRRLLAENAFPFAVGDEVLTFDGRSVDEVVGELKAKAGRLGANPATEQSLAESALTRRSPSRGFSAIRGSSTVGVKPSGSQEVQQVRLLWEYREELARKLPPREKDPIRHLMKTESLLSFYKDRMGECLEDHNPFGIGERKGFLPDLGTIIWRTEPGSPLDAYIYQIEDRRSIGYLRIPSYTYGCGCHGGMRSWDVYANLLNHLEANSDALVIDQHNNPGGAVLLVYGLASMFADKPFSVPQHREKITVEEAMEARKAILWLKEFDSDKMVRDALDYSGDGSWMGVPINLQFVRYLKQYFEGVLEEWGQGHTLTRPLPIIGIEKLNPSPFARYTKPVLVLVNELDFSGGDFFPGILQDNDRVTVMGSRTAGAGGYVRSSFFPNSHGLYGFRYTGSIAERADSSPLEDLGVTPDVPYEVSANDLQNNFADYVQAINAQIDSMIE